MLKRLGWEVCLYMKTLYKFIFLTVIISSVFYFALNRLSIPTTEKVSQPLIQQENQYTRESNPLQNNVGICVENSLPFHDHSNTEISKQGDWHLIWQDEFENNCLDFNNWNIEDWAAEKNNELQYYSPNNVKVEDGLLKLISKNEKFKGREYTSGAVQSKGKFNFLYGKAEMRAKLPAGQGVFPAFWMMPEKEDTWLPEIDILEMLGHKPNEIWMVLHWLDTNGSLKSDYSIFIGPDFSKDFHIFSIEWTPDSITWFIDGIEQFKSNKFIPNENMYLYLNTAIGGDWPGSPDDTTVFPVIYEIDYVRVFQRHDE